MQYLQVKNWDSFQQYRDRDPKWIKLHRDVLDDYGFDSLTEIQQCHLIKIWLLAAKLGNKIPNDPKWIAKKIGAQSKVDIEQLVTSGFLLPYGNVQECTDVYLEREGETETEGEKKHTSASVKKPDEISQQVWADWKRTRRAPLTPTAWKKIKSELDAGVAKGHTMDEMLSTAIEAGWRGFQLEWFENRTKEAKSESPAEKAAREAREYRDRKRAQA